MTDLVDDNDARDVWEGVGVLLAVSDFSLREILFLIESRAKGLGVPPRDVAAYVEMVGALPSVR